SNEPPPRPPIAPQLNKRPDPAPLIKHTTSPPNDPQPTARPLHCHDHPPTPANAICISPTTAHATGERREVRNGTERDTKEVCTINESTACCTPTLLDWTADVKETIGFTPPACVDRAH